MKIPALTILLLAATLTTHAQVSEGSKIGMSTGRGLNATRSESFLTAPSAASDVKGDFYVDSLWQLGGVLFRKAIPQIGGGETDSLAGIKVRYNVLNNELEVLANEQKNDIRVIKGGMLKSFMVNGIAPETFINVSAFQSERELTGFGEVLSAGNHMLIKHYRTRITKPNYNPGFATGEKNTIVRIEHDYYVIENGAARKADLGRKIPELFAGDKQKAETFSKENALNLKREEDVVRLFDHMNGR